MPPRLLADGGYASRENVESTSKQKTEFSAPWGEDAERHKGALVRNGIAEEFGPRAFVHQAGHGVPKVLYEAPAGACAGCAHREPCCGKAAQGRGRRVDRVRESAAVQAYLARMASEEGQQAYKHRSHYGEFAQLQISRSKGRWG